MVLAELGGKLRESLRKLHAASASGLDTRVLDTLLSEISRALIESDVNVKLVMTLRNNIKNRVGESLRHHEENSGGASSAQNIVKLVQKSVTDELIALLSPENVKPYVMKKNKPNVILFVGLQGAGKTTTIAKYANYYQRRGFKVAMVCADTFRAGAFDQLKQNATKLRVPFYGSYTVADPISIAEEGVEHFLKEKYEVIIVDTSGRHKQESALFDEMREINAAVRADNIVFVMDATQGQAVYDQAFAFKEAVEVGSVIVTKLDGHAKGGGALSAVAATKSPIIFIGSGEKFDDLDAFNAQSFVSKLLGWGDLSGFFDEMKAISNTESHMELMESVAKGQYTLRDMYKQFQSMMKMGPMSKVMEMMPGMEAMAPMFAGEEGTKQFRTMLYIMDSMTDAELDGKVDWHNRKGIDTTIESRVMRISRGSGTHPKEVKLLLKYHKYFEKMIKVGKTAGTMSKQKHIAEQIKKNPNAMLNKMNPQMIQQLGGRDAVLNMMQQMKGGGGGPNMPPTSGMPDMASMSRMMQQMGLGGGGNQMPDSNAFAQMMQQMGMGGRR